jgi:selenocysteine lyase/cysteine desulfurase
MLASQRHLFDLGRDIAYLDAAYMSPIPTVAVTAGERGVRVKAAPWKMTIHSYYDEVEELRALAASMIAAEADDIGIVAATASGMSIAAANVPVAQGSCIVLMENEHTSNRYVWYELAREKGAEILIAPRPEDGNWTEALVSTIRGSVQPVALVAGTLVHWFEGMAVDLEAVARACREAGAALVVDGTQWVGALPFDVRTVRPDFLSFATYKFLLGPYRLAFLYADKRWHENGRTFEHHSWNREGGERPDFYKENVLPFQPGARRFDMGQRSDFATLPIAIASLRLLQGWTLPAVAGRLIYLNERIWQEAEERGWVAWRPRFRVPHIAILDLGDRIAPDAGARLNAAGNYVTMRGSKMRVSPHVYNDEEDIARLFDNLAPR